MRAEGGDLLAVRPRDQPALRPRVARAGRHIIRVEQIGEPLVEDAIAGKVRDQQELLEEPGGMRAMPLGRAGIRHRLHELVLGAQASPRAARFRRARREKCRARGSADRSGAAFRIVAAHCASLTVRRMDAEVTGAMPNPGFSEIETMRDMKPIWGSIVPLVYVIAPPLVPLADLIRLARRRGARKS